MNKISEEESDAYFNSRPVGSQLGAVASHQSETVLNREILEKHLTELKKDHMDRMIKRPDVWGGYIVNPVSVEFWQGRANRLHDRVLYSQDSGGNWLRVRLQP